MKYTYLINPLLLLFCLFTNSCQGQAGTAATKSPGAAGNRVGGPCDGCELIWIGMPPILQSTDTSLGWNETGQKLLVKGTIFQRDGRTPAPDVILYYWQTDNNGYYSPGEELPEKAKRHGHIRGWVKTGKGGAFSIYTIRPLAYPGETIPAHIHLVVKEPSISNEYYVDDILFEEDPLLTRARKAEIENRGGSGIVKIKKYGSMQIAEHNIVLGLNIPGYPK